MRGIDLSPAGSLRAAFGGDLLSSPFAGDWQDRFLVRWGTEALSSSLAAFWPQAPCQLLATWASAGAALGQAA